MSRALLAVVLCGCAASSDPGLDAQLQINGAQFVPGTMPAGIAGPAVITMNIAAYTLFPGAQNQPLLGTLAADATSVAFALSSDRGYWVLPAGIPDTEMPDLPTFATTMAFSTTLLPGPMILVGRAVDAAGQLGPPRRATITVQRVPLPSGHLVVSLAWDRASDLDLHLIDPTGVEVWANKSSTSPALASEAGALDFDSNSQCAIDGRNRESVVYENAAPAGHYRVRVDTFSLCGQAVANWIVEAFVDGQSLGRASGVSLETDTIGPHGRGAGRTALDFELR